MNSLNIFNRSEYVEMLQKQTFDVLIIGGGITGAGIALDAANRGMKVALVEMQDFSAGTSSRSTKLIHGGLRYLKNGEIGLVMETGRERAILHRNAPHLVHPEKMLLPLVKKGQLGKTTTRIALWVYDLLAGVKKKDRMRMLNKQQTLELQKGFNESQIVGGALYSEYRTDDSRLTISVLKTATEKGAIALNYMQCVGVQSNKTGCSSVEVKDLRTNARHEIAAKKIVNATGPWVDELRKMDGPLGNKHLHLTKGIHLVVSGQHLKINQSCYVEIDDGRMIFAIPREGKVYVGTTDTDYIGDKTAPSLEKADLEYLLKAINNIFPEAGLTKSHVVSYWAGLRPLISEHGKNNSEISRKDEIFISENGLISIAGGKLTAYRKMAERVVDLLAKNLHHKRVNTTKNTQLSGAAEIEEIEPTLSRFCAFFENSGFWKNHLWTRYGSNSSRIIENYEQIKAEQHLEENLLIAEYQYCMENESCFGVFDFFSNRNAWLLFHPEKIEPHLESLIEYAIKRQVLSEQSVEQERKKFVNWVKIIDSL